jgi:hypothetical protein
VENKKCYRVFEERKHTLDKLSKIWNYIIGVSSGGTMGVDLGGRKWGICFQIGFLEKINSKQRRKHIKISLKIQ